MCRRSVLVAWTDEWWFGMYDATNNDDGHKSVVRRYVDMRTAMIKSVLVSGRSAALGEVSDFFYIPAWATFQLSFLSYLNSALPRTILLHAHNDTMPAWSVRIKIQEICVIDRIPPASAFSHGANKGSRALQTAVHNCETSFDGAASIMSWCRSFEICQAKDEGLRIWLRRKEIDVNRQPQPRPDRDVALVLLDSNRSTKILKVSCDDLLAHDRRPEVEAVAVAVAEAEAEAAPEEEVAEEDVMLVRTDVVVLL